MKKKLLIVLGIILVCFVGYFVVEKSKTENFPHQAPLFNNLGSFHRPVSTNVLMAQRYFDQGLVLFYAFEWSESIRSFQEATRLDPNCAMCYWGLALSLHNKINAPVQGDEFTRGQKAIQHAQTLLKTTTPVESELIQALALVYRHAPIPKTEESAFSCHEIDSEEENQSQKDKAAYIDAMKKISTAFPHDADVQSLYASVLFFSIAGTEATFDNPKVVEATQVLKNALSESPTHAGLNHYYIHITEPYSRPQDAEASATLLKTLVPGSQHLVHMPSHVYLRTGRYHEASQANMQAIEAYKQYNKDCYDQGFEPEINYLYFHNYDFLRSTAILEGDSKTALWAARKIVEEPYATWLRDSAALQWFMPIPYFVEARFGLWDDILLRPKPDEKYGYATAMWHYARGMAFAHTKKLNDANLEATQMKKTIEQGATNNNLGETGLKLLGIGNSVLLATIADRNGDEKAVFEHLHAARAVQEGMGYHEPPDWYFPIKQALGDAYLKWGHPEKAKEMYELDLVQYPHNGWSLYGLEKSLRALDQNKAADDVHTRFKEAWKYADVPAPVTMFPNQSPIS